MIPSAPRSVRLSRQPAVAPAIALLLSALFALPLRAQDEAPSRKVTAEDLPRIPATEPDQALGTFRLAKDCRLELVAAEPLVADPVDACFDEFGRMFVAEMHGYPFSQEPTRLNPAGGGKKDAGIIRMLEDTDGDGRMDRSVVFADQISWPTSVCCYDGGLFVLAPQYLYYFKDTDGDGKADVREVVLSGFGRDNVQSLANSLKWSLDNRIYFAAGRNPFDLTHRGKPLEAQQGSDLRFDPRTEQFESVTGGQQFGLSMDDWGNRFVCSNSNHIQQVIYPQHYLARNPYLAVSGLIRSIAEDGASARVYRTSPPEPWRIIRQKWRAEAKGYKLVINEDGAWEFIPLDPSKKQSGAPTEYPVGYFTSATGITIYRGAAYPEEFRQNAFVGDVGGNLVHRKTLTPDGVAYSARRADQGEEFIRSTDNWFRPVNFVNAPDGTLYVLDMYRETVEHPYSIPDEIKQFLHLTSGSDRGRVYRIVTPGMQRVRPQRLGDMSDEQLVAQLESDNAWNRETAQRLLYERQTVSVAPALSELVRSSENPAARLHALYTLAGLDKLAAEDLERGLRDPHPRVREHAVRLSEPLLKQPEAAGVSGLIARLPALCEDPDQRVRFQLAFTLGEMPAAQAVDGLARLAKDPANREEVRTALLSSVTGIADKLVARLLQDESFLEARHSGSLLSELCLVIGADRDTAPATRLLQAATAADQSPAVQQLLLTSLGEGLNRRGSSIARLLRDESTGEEVREQVARMFQSAAETALEEDAPVERRTEAVGLLAFADFETAAEPLAELLSPRTPAPLQRAAVASLSRQSSEEAARLLLEGWRTYSPQLRRDVVDALLTSAGRIEVLLAAIESNRVGRGELERDKKQLLLSHPTPAIREASRELFGNEVDTDRARVVAAHQPVLDLTGDVKRGEQVFKQKCAVCHQVGNTGHAVAPDLVSVQNKSPADLLIAILDPNREAQPNFNTYNVLTDSGRIYNGIIAAETAGSITLRRAEGKEDVILRDNIESLVSTGTSLMPEGLEKELTPRDLADVIEFVKSIKPPSAGGGE